MRCNLRHRLRIHTLVTTNLRSPISPRPTYARKGYTARTKTDERAYAYLFNSTHVRASDQATVPEPVRDERRKLFQVPKRGCVRELMAGESGRCERMRYPSPRREAAAMPFELVGITRSAFSWWAWRCAIARWRRWRGGAPWPSSDCGF
jgi:hypothetical protein